ncbi:hypothetical protein TNIN_253841 [Trichonephila inaurata madagascariensis]|uniref:Uncharacterized protein n=1 Tax=Trichonephila inaurata madagascariensis TaxID=2747483 RepID=A0A8X6Y7T7_9ARAC|nr:hypothetical protein TNIN_253841 [Trichonephila inaurata madagascariensis]
MKAEHVMVRHPLDDHMTCLPVAEVEIECDLGYINIKSSSDREPLGSRAVYLGNQTAALLRNWGNCSSDVGKVNTVVTRAQTRQSRENEIFNEPGPN